MGVMASQIADVSTVCSTVCSGTHQENIKAPRHWPLLGESTGDRWFPLAKGHWRGFFSFDDVIMALRTHWSWTSSKSNLSCAETWLLRDIKVNTMTAYMMMPWSRTSPGHQQPYNIDNVGMGRVCTILAIGMPRNNRKWKYVLMFDMFPQLFCVHIISAWLRPWSPQPWALLMYKTSCHTMMNLVLTQPRFRALGLQSGKKSSTTWWRR